MGASADENSLSGAGECQCSQQSRCFEDVDHPLEVATEDASSAFAFFSPFTRKRGRPSAISWSRTGVRRSLAKLAGQARPGGTIIPYAEAEAEFEKHTLEQALAAGNGQISEAAKMLQISRATFDKKLAKFGLASGPASV